MKAVVVAAGRGRRLGPLTDDVPKPLLGIGGTTILEHQLGNLADCGIDDIVIVTGYRADMIERLAGPDLTYIHNPFYETSNSLVSLWLARQQLEREFVYLHADIVFDSRILGDLIADPRDICLAIERKSCVEEDMKVRLRGDRVLEIGKSLDSAVADGEFTGLARFSRRGGDLLCQALDVIVRQGDLMLWFESAVQLLIDGGCPVHCLETDGRPWIEIDFPGDLEVARRSVYPRLAARDSSLATLPVSDDR